MNEILAFFLVLMAANLAAVVIAIIIGAAPIVFLNLIGFGFATAGAIESA